MFQSQSLGLMEKCIAYTGQYLITDEKCPVSTEHFLSYKRFLLYLRHSLVCDLGPGHWQSVHRFRVILLMIELSVDVQEMRQSAFYYISSLCSIPIKALGISFYKATRSDAFKHVSGSLENAIHQTSHIGQSFFLSFPRHLLLSLWLRS